MKLPDAYWNPYCLNPFATVATCVAAVVFLSRSLLAAGLANVREWLKPGQRPRSIGLFALAIGWVGCVVTAAGCCVPCRGSCGASCAPMPANYCLPTPPNYGEPMHPIFRQDGRQVLVPHTQFKGWINDDAPSPTTPSGP